MYHTVRALESLLVRVCRIVEPCSDSVRCALSVSRSGSSYLDMHSKSIYNHAFLRESQKSPDVDIFTKKLQQKTERELEQLMDQQSRQSKVQVDQSEEHETGVKEIGGPKGPEPTRYGDWERAGRCSDF